MSHSLVSLSLPSIINPDTTSKGIQIDAHQSSSNSSHPANSIQSEIWRHISRDYRLGPNIYINLILYVLGTDANTY
jgi:hypothetical protein